MGGRYTALQHHLDAVPLADFATALWMTAVYALLAFPSAPRQATIMAIVKCVPAQAQACPRARLPG